MAIGWFVERLPRKTPPSFWQAVITCRYVCRGTWGVPFRVHFTVYSIVVLYTVTGKRICTMPSRVSTDLEQFRPYICISSAPSQEICSYIYRTQLLVAEQCAPIYQTLTIYGVTNVAGFVHACFTSKCWISFAHGVTRSVWFNLQVHLVLCLGLQSQENLNLTLNRLYQDACWMSMGCRSPEVALLEGWW